MNGQTGSGRMRGRKLRSGSLMALLGALILVLGAAPTFGQNRESDVFDRKPDKGTSDYPHKAGRVTIWFTKDLVTDIEGQETTISVEDSCGRILSNNDTTSWNRKVSQEEQNWRAKAWVMLDRRNTNPKGLYYVTAEYWLESDEEENSEDPEGEDPPAAQARTYTYKFRVHGGPNCDGSGGGGNHPPGHDPGDNGDKKRVWGNTSGDDHDHTGGHVGSENLRSPVNSSSPTHSDHTDMSDFDPYTS